MTVLVLDASVAAKWFFPERHTQEARRVLETASALHAPDTFLLEVDNVVLKRLRRGHISRKDGADIRSAIRTFPVTLHPFSMLLDPAWEIAARTGRSLYDCLYVSLAVILGCRVVTADRKLHEGLATGPVGEHVLWVGDGG